MHTVEYNVNNRIILARYYPIDILPPSFAGTICDFYDIWRNSRGSKKIPSRTDIKFENLRGWHSQIRLVDMGDSPEGEKRNLILGEKYQEYWGKKTLRSQIEDMGSAGKPILEKYIESLKYLYNGYYGLNTGLCPNSDSSFKKAIWIDLPLANDGENLTHLLTAISPKI